MKNIKTISIILLVIVFIAPALGTFLSTIGQNAETNQYAGLQWAVMGVYNLPFFITSLVTLLVGESFYKKQKVNVSTILFSVSILSSIVGTVLMLLWGLGTLS